MPLKKSKNSSLALTKRMSPLLHFLEVNALTVCMPKNVNDRYLDVALMFS